MVWISLGKLACHALKRMYLEQYGGSADVGIGKVLYSILFFFRKVGKSFVTKSIRRRKTKA
jgi:hypothetical protein